MGMGCGVSKPLVVLKWSSTVCGHLTPGNPWNTWEFYGPWVVECRGCLGHCCSFSPKGINSSDNCSESQVRGSELYLGKEKKENRRKCPPLPKLC